MVAPCRTLRSSDFLGLFRPHVDAVGLDLPGLLAEALHLQERLQLDDDFQDGLLQLIGCPAVDAVDEVPLWRPARARQRRTRSAATAAGACAAASTSWRRAPARASSSTSSRGEGVDGPRQAEKKEMEADFSGRSSGRRKDANLESRRKYDQTCLLMMSRQIWVKRQTDTTPLSRADKRVRQSVGRVVALGHT